VVGREGEVGRKRRAGLLRYWLYGRVHGIGCLKVTFPHNSLNSEYQRHCATLRTVQSHARILVCSTEKVLPRRKVKKRESGSVTAAFLDDSSLAKKLALILLFSPPLLVFCWLLSQTSGEKFSFSNPIAFVQYYYGSTSKHCYSRSH
jgi:hypothetical protein